MPSGKIMRFRRRLRNFRSFIPGRLHLCREKAGRRFCSSVSVQKEFWDEVTAKPEYEDKTILIATHGCALRAILHNIYEDKADFWHGFVPVNCAVSVVEIKDGNAKLIGGRSNLL